MPIRPVGRPRKAAAERYKEAEIACQRNVRLAPSHHNVFDLEQDDIAKVDSHKDQLFNTQHQDINPVQLMEGIQSNTMPGESGHGVVNTKGMKHFHL